MFWGILCKVFKSERGVLRLVVRSKCSGAEHAKQRLQSSRQAWMRWFGSEFLRILEVWVEELNPWNTVFAVQISWLHKKFVHWQIHFTKCWREIGKWTEVNLTWSPYPSRFRCGLLPQISKVAENGEIGQMRPSEYEGAGLPEPLVIFGSPKWRMFLRISTISLALCNENTSTCPSRGGPFHQSPYIAIYHLAGERKNSGHLGSNRYRTTCYSPWIFQIKSTWSNGKPLKFHACQQSSLVIYEDDVEGIM